MRFVALAASAVHLTGCFHATIDTGLQPSGQKVEKNWAHGFLYGLVPPSTVETASKCPNGVAKVETKLSFLNRVASVLTSGIYMAGERKRAEEVRERVGEGLTVLQRQRLRAYWEDYVVAMR